MNIPLVYGEEVAEAITAGQPVVALPSGVLRSGPDSAETARLVEDAVRASGSVPATIGIDKGRILVGLSETDIERFASTPGVPEVGSRDLPVVLARGTMGATTVASSLIAAELAGLKFLSAAAVGGVHRDARRVSPDLVQFTRSKVAVVCAGARSTLDLGLTLEFLETHGVPVVAYRSDDFPAFYCVSSGLRGPHRVDDPAVLARAIESHWALGNPGSFLVTTPTKPADAIDGAEIESVITAALAAGTKYLERAVDRATEGRSAKAGMAVLINTAEVAGELAAAHAKEFPS
ncbi:pseudouridine-5'-phosphate glycosidase [Lentzea waywayandensis]|uniref:Pseudouridine-5'-phosphate glycosidase n=1 Tax=Lentzea waywayandensis TaxID=84724 RepID=A0A1I6EXB2_9PSEU|nr:pseudouridine-5'-phosphate glycosidase [Lentzea waywayandensis]SFR22291.1 pseudouridine-5'-phosphate glycosidase [Lentzea waywayandensis]